MSTLVADLLAAADPAEIAMRAGITPDPWQQTFLRSTSDRILLNCSCQSGKSTMAAVRACHTALYDAGSLTLLVSPSERQSGELAAKVRAVMAALEWPLPVEQQSALQLRLSNGSRIVALPGKEGTIRGYSGVQLLILDEAARVPDELVEAVRPMLAVSSGTMVMLSTPFGTRGAFYEAWRSRERWAGHPGPAHPKEFLDEEERTLGRWAFRQEYCCEFLADAGAVFDHQDILRAVACRDPASWIDEAERKEQRDHERRRRPGSCWPRLVGWRPCRQHWQGRGGRARELLLTDGVHA